MIVTVERVMNVGKVKEQVNHKKVDGRKIIGGKNIKRRGGRIVVTWTCGVCDQILNKSVSSVTCEGCLFKRFARKDVRRCSFTMRITNGWNCLTNEIVNARKTSEFKARLDAFTAARTLVRTYDMYRWN